MKHVALDGTKIKANASKHKAMSYGRMKEAELRLQKEIEQYLRENQAIDEREDRKLGPDRQGDELPPELAAREKRLARIREAKAALEAEARQREQEQNADCDSAANNAGSNEVSKRHRKNRARRLRKHPPGTPKDKAQYNFTDPEFRIMLNSDKTYIQAYNAQAAVDSKNQIIVAAELTNQAQDGTHLPKVIKAVKANLNQKPYGLSADAGYFSDTNLTHLKDEVIARIFHRISKSTTLHRFLLHEGECQKTCRLLIGCGGSCKRNGVRPNMPCGSKLWSRFSAKGGPGL